MRVLMIFIICLFFNCGSRIEKKDVLIIDKKRHVQNNLCTFTITIDNGFNNITLSEFPCDSFDVGDTIKIYD